MEPITFFAYKEGPDDKTPFIPCSLTVVVDPGGRHKDGKGVVYQEAATFVQFNKQGIARVSDSKQLAVLRKLATPGSGITEDYEEFMSRTLPSARQAGRLQKQLEAAQEETNRLKEQMRQSIPKAPVQPLSA